MMFYVTSAMLKSCRTDGVNVAFRAREGRERTSRVQGLELVRRLAGGSTWGDGEGRVECEDKGGEDDSPGGVTLPP